MVSSALATTQISFRPIAWNALVLYDGFAVQLIRSLSAYPFASCFLNVIVLFDWSLDIFFTDYEAIFNYNYMFCIYSKIARLPKRGSFDCRMISQGRDIS